MARDIRAFADGDGTNWGVEVRMPSASNAMVMFRHPGGGTGRLDRYAWYQWHGPESRSVTSRVSPATVMKTLGRPELELLFRRSMPVSAGTHPLNEHRTG